MSGVSVIVAVHGNASSLPGLLDCLAVQDCGQAVEVVVVDNHPVRRVVARPGLERVVHEPHPGISAARNAGIAAARGEFVLFTDPDARPDPGWARGMVAALSRPGVVAVGGRVRVWFPGHRRTPRVWRQPGVAQWFVPPAWPEATTDLVAPWWVCGCNLGLRRDALERPDSTPAVFSTWLGVRPRRHLTCEDLELTHRMAAVGRVLVASEAVVHRAVHPGDLRWRALLRRGWGHGVSLARVRALHPDMPVHDPLRFVDVLRSVSGLRARAVHVARVAGMRRESRRLAAVAAGADAYTQAVIR